MRTLTRLLGTAAATGAVLFAAALPASAATPAQANYSGDATSSSAAGAKQAALNAAYAQAARAGFGSAQCLPLGTPDVWNNGPLNARATARTAAPQILPGNQWEATWGVQCTTQPAANTVNLNRFNGPEHLSTTGPEPSGYYLEGSLGWLYTSQVAGTVPLFSCKVWNSTDTFTSQAGNCEGQQYLGELGFAYSTPPAGVATRVLRRCQVNGEHFDSNDINCEGQYGEGVLGYTLD
ncbi:hypothetical protein ACFYNO_14190 [Kitasatospora sp. NPDC006697]|uniref:hypothetical protein n=1 Tax=Kitasatospora sp. NPDC006697 TaxID=3364020 RepID=UPI0036949292